MDRHKVHSSRRLTGDAYCHVARSVALIFAVAAGVFLLAPARSLQAASVTLEWRGSPAPDIAAYVVYFGTASRYYTRSVYAGGDTSATLSGLTEGTTYYFAVTALNSWGLQSDPSDEIAFRVPVAPGSTYGGLFREPDAARPETAGYFTVTITSRGSYSGRLQQGSIRRSFSGQLNTRSQASNLVKRSGAVPLVLEWGIDQDPSGDQLAGRVSDGNWSSPLLARRALSRTALAAARFGTRYTTVVAGWDGDAALPAGDGYGALQVKASGAVSFAGALADGVRISGGGPLTATGWWPCFLSANAGRELVLGWLVLTNEAGSDLNGTLAWIKRADPRASCYPAGFTNECQIAGSIYTPPARGAPVFQSATLSLTFSGGDLSSDLALPVTAQGGRPGNKFRGIDSAVDLVSATGLFKGQATLPGDSRPRHFFGAVLQNRNLGYGFLLGTNRSARVALLP